MRPLSRGVIVAVLTAAVIAAHPVTRSVFVATIVVLAPGAALAAAIFPPSALRWAERLAIATGLGLGSAALASTLVAASPTGLQSWSALGAVAFVSALGAAIAVCRRHVVIPTIAVPTTVNRWVVATMVTAVLAGLSLGIARSGAAQHEANQTFVEFWMRPSERSDSTLEIGVTSRELAAATFDVVLESDGREVARWGDVHLASGQTWTTGWSVPDDVSATSWTATLNREGGEVPFRRASFRMMGKGP